MILPDTMTPEEMERATLPETMTNEEMERESADGGQKTEDGSLPDTMTPEEMEKATLPDTMTPEEMEKATLPDTMTPDEMDGLTGNPKPAGVVKRIGREIAAQGREIATQAAAGVVRDLPRMLYDTAAAVLPGEAPSPSNPQGTGAAGWAGRVSDDITGAESAATWDDAKRTGWAGVPGAAARSLAPNLLAGFATGGASVAAMPFFYGGSRAEQIYRKIRDEREGGGRRTEGGEGSVSGEGGLESSERRLEIGEWGAGEKAKARLHAAGAGLLEGGLEYVSNLVGVNKQVRELMRGTLKAGMKEAAARPVAAWLRGLGTALKEGATEFVQEGGGQLHEQLLWISDQIAERPESILEISPEGWGRIWDAAKYAAAAGVLSSGAVGGIQAAERRVKETRAAREKAGLASSELRLAIGEQRVVSGESGVVSGESGMGPEANAGGLDEQAENYDEVYPEAEAGTEGAQPEAGTENPGGAAAAAAIEAGGQKTEEVGPRTVTPEQEEKAQKEAEEAKRKEAETWRKANKGKGAAVSDLLIQNHPVAARVLELGGIRGDGTEDQWGLPAAYRNPNTSNTLDMMLKELATDAVVGPMVADWTTDDLKDALTGNKREMARTAKPKPVTPEEREWLKSGSVTVGPENLALGFTFTVKGRSYAVTDADEDGYVIEERGVGSGESGVGSGELRGGTGKILRLGHGGLMTVDKDSVRSANGKRVLKMKTAARPEDLARFEEGARQREEAVNAEAEALGLGSVGENEDGGRKTEAGGTEEGDGGLLPGEDGGTDEDLPFRETGTRDAQQNTQQQEKQPENGKPRARGLTIIQRGYDAERGAADDPAYSRFGMHPLDLPELVELAEDLLDGKTPRVVRRVNPAGTALGSVRFGRETNAAGEPVYGRPETIKLLAANYKLISDDEAEAWRAELAEQYGEDEAGAAAAFGERYMAELKERIKKGPRLAMSVIAHEIGHVADQMTRYGIPKLDRSQGKNRLNLVGRVAGMLSYTRDILAADPSGRTLNRDEVRLLQAEARRNARPDKRGRELFEAMKDKWAELPPEEQLRHDLISAKSFRDALEYMAAERPVLSEWFAISTWAEQVRAVQDALGAMAYEGRTMTAETRRLGSAWFRQEFVGQLEKRRQAHLGKMYSELEALLGWWNGGERTMMEQTLDTPGEMFAEAFGVFLNNPKAVQKRAPMFWRTLNAYMESRPQAAEWLEEFNRGMSAGPETVLNRRLQRVRENFSEETRAARSAMTEAARQSTGKRTAWDMTQYLGVSKSLPLRALVRTAERMKLKGLADAASGMADKIENLRGLEDLYRTMNLEVGRILDEGDLTVQDFDAWGLLDMAARSPAYAEKANPNGLHPEAARQTLEEYRRQLGDARAETLERAVAKAQEIWQSEIVTRLEQWGGYDKALIRFVKENPVYFTLQVGMDKAELAAWHTAIQNQDMEQIAALAQRNIEKGLPGAGKVGAEIHARKGTHRMPVSLLGATMLKGQALLADAAHNEMKRIGQALLIGVNDPLYTPIAEGETGRDTESQVVVKYRADGKEVAYYAPKYVGHFLRGDNPANAVNRGLRTMPVLSHFYLVHRLLKAAQTVASVKFMLTQPWSDRKAWNTQMPGVKTPLGNIAAGSVIGGLAQMMPAATWYLPPGMFPKGSRERMMRPMRELARAYYRTGKIDGKLRTLIERGMYDLGGAWQGIEGDNPHPGEIIGRQPLSATPKSFETYAKETGRAARAAQALGRVPVVRDLWRGFHWTQESMYAETLANKLAGMEYLDAKYPGMDERQKREWVLKAAGNPNFASRGGADPLIDVLAWAFYNPAKEGWRSAIYAAKNDPKGFALRTAYYNVVPSMLAHAAKLGLLASAAAALIPHGETPEEEEKREGFLRGFERWCGLFGRIGSYYNKRYVAIPIAPVGQDSALTVTIPQAQSFAPLNGLINLALDEAAQLAGMKPDDDKGIEKAIQAVTGEMQGIPSLLGMSRGMPQQVFGPALALLLTDNTNTYDPFYGKMQLDREEEALMKGGKLTARAMPAWHKIFKNAWNSAGGSMFGRFDTKTPRADTAQKTEVQKILTAPGIGALVGGWLRVTGGGEYESLQEMFAPEEAERAHKAILARRAAVETLNSKDGAYPAWAAEMMETDMDFARAVNRFRVRADIYEGLTPEEKILMNRANPRWKREMVIERDLNRRLKEREPSE